MADLTGAIGMCLRAGACSFGFENAQKMLQKKKCAIVLVQENASEASKKRISDKCKYYGVKIVVTDLSDTFYRLNIKETTKIVSVNDVNFKNLIEKRLKGET